MPAARSVAGRTRSSLSLCILSVYSITAVLMARPHRPPISGQRRSHRLCSYRHGDAQGSGQRSRQLVSNGFFPPSVTQAGQKELGSVHPFDALALPPQPPNPRLWLDLASAGGRSACSCPVNESLVTWGSLNETD